QNVSAALTIGSLTRNAGATVNFVGNNLALGATTISNTNKINFTTTPTQTTVNNGTILPFGIVTNPNPFVSGVTTVDFATVNATSAGGIAPFAGYVFGLANSGSPNDVVKTGAQALETLTTSKTVAAVLMGGNSTVTATGFTLTVGTGAIVGI